MLCTEKISQWVHGNKVYWATTGAAGEHTEKERSMRVCWKRRRVSCRTSVCACISSACNSLPVGGQCDWIPGSKRAFCVCVTCSVDVIVVLGDCGCNSQRLGRRKHGEIYGFLLLAGVSCICCVHSKHVTRDFRSCHSFRFYVDTRCSLLCADVPL
jgi:hypothetical protein